MKTSHLKPNELVKPETLVRSPFSLSSLSLPVRCGQIRLTFMSPLSYMRVVAGLPRAHLLTVESISTTTLEFLRHFWSSILPPRPNDTSAFALAPVKERNARAEKFKGYLEKSRERIGKAIEEAEKEGGGPEGELKKRVEAVSTCL